MSDLNPDTRRLVELAREARTPGEDDKLRIAQRLAVPLAAGALVGTAAKAAAGAGASATGSSFLGGLGLKIAAVALLGAVGSAVVVGQFASEPSTPQAPVKQLAPAAPAPAEPAPAVVSAPAPPEQPSEPAVTPKPSVAAHGKAADDLAQEAVLLHEAQSAWRAGQSAQALSLANQHAKRFPRSQLANERDVLRVLSLCKLGQVQAAKQVGARLLRQAKGSPWYQSVAGSCAAD